MKIKNIEELKKNLNQSTALIFVIIFTSALFGLNFTHNKYTQKRALLNKQEISFAGNIFKSNLSEKLSIIASSTIFLDYLRSGDTTRNRLFPQFLAQISSLKSKSISGMSLFDIDGRNIYNNGDVTSTFITLNLCYLNQTLDPEMGDCRYSWRLYFKKNDLINEISSVNNAIKSCTNCNYFNILDTNGFGSFPIKNSNNFKLNLSITNENDYFFYIYLLLMSIALVLFGFWSWYRLNNLLTEYIANPIAQLTSNLKSDAPFKQANNLDEIKYLMNEITTWKLKLNKMQSDEHAAKLGQIAAQLAHDIRSPLSAIDMLIRSVPNVPTSLGLTLKNAIQRISDISNNFLLQYKMPKAHQETLKPSYENIQTILENMVSEKRTQYVNSKIDINLYIDNNSKDILAYIEPIDFKRIVSNLINNSIEAISNTGYVNLHVLKCKDYLNIEIYDNGCGIPEEFIESIAITGMSIGKKYGSGLGLSHAIKKIQDWHGKVEIRSTVGIGTKITILIPISLTI